MTSVAASEFTRNFDRYREAAQREPVEVTAQDEVTGYFVSAHEFQTLQQAKYRPRSVRVEDLDNETLELLRNSRMDERHAHLDHLMD